MLDKPLSPSVPDAVPTEITPIRVTHGGIKSDLNSSDLIDRDPYNAIDKNLKSQIFIIGDGAKRPAWLKLDFNKEQLIHKVIFYSRFYTKWFYPSNECVSNEGKFKGCVDKANHVDVSVYRQHEWGEVHQRSCGTLQLTYGLEQSDQIYTLVCNIVGDSVKLSKAIGEIRVWEIVIIGTGN